MRTYGLPYMGSKSKIAKHIVPLLPNANTFVDLFAGGGAVTHYAMTTNKYRHFIYNDLNPLMPKAFEMALKGEFENETRWISREDFFRLRDTDPYVAICFSFGNNLSDYMYNKDIEPIKEAYHYAVFFGDYSLAKERMGIDLTPLSKCATIEDKYALLKRIAKSTPPIQSKQGCSRQRECGESTMRFTELGEVQKVYWNFQSLESHQRCILPPPKNLEQGNIKRPLTDVIDFYSTDYQNVPIPQNSVIYCDIPYIGKGEYQKHKNVGFDYERFYDWAERQLQPIFISEYQMPEDRFTAIAEIKRTGTMSATNNAEKVTERIFIPKHQKTIIKRQLNLF